MKIYALTASTNAPHRCGPARRPIAPVLVLMAALVASTGLSACRWRPPAATINGQEISAEELQADLRVLRENPGLVQAVFGGPAAIGDPEFGEGVVPALVTASVLRYRIIEKLVIDAGNASTRRPDEQTLETTRKEVYDQLVALLGPPENLTAAGANQATAGQAELVKELDPDTLRLVERRSRFFAYAAVLFDGLDDQQRAETEIRVVGGGEITIDPRYGSWDSASVQVVLPSHTPADQVDLAS